MLRRKSRRIALALRSICDDAAIRPAQHDRRRGSRRLRPRGAASRTRSRRAALKVAAEPVAPAYSPIVLAGAVRMIEFALVALVGAAIYVAYVVPHRRLRVALLRRHRRRSPCWRCWRSRPPTSTRCRRSAATRSSISGSPPPGRWCSCIVIGVSFFAKAGDQFSRVWLGSFYVDRPARAARRSAARCSCWCGAGPSEGRLDAPHRHRRRRRAPAKR